MWHFKYTNRHDEILLILFYCIEYAIHPISQDWGKAQEICDIHGRSLLPDIGLDGFKKSGIFEDLEAEELVWLNAKDVKIGYLCKYP
jgi:hypothetical protein